MEILSEILKDKSICNGCRKEPAEWPHNSHTLEDFKDKDLLVEYCGTDSEQPNQAYQTIFLIAHHWSAEMKMIIQYL